MHVGMFCVKTVEVVLKELVNAVLDSPARTAKQVSKKNQLYQFSASKYYIELHKNVENLSKFTQCGWLKNNVIVFKNLYNTHVFELR